MNDLHTLVSRWVRLVLLASLCVGCGGETKQWQIVHQDLPAALLSVWGTSKTDVWAVGGDVRDGSGPLVIHYDGSSWQRVNTGEQEGDLWWVFGFENGPIYMGGDGGVILRYEGGTFTKEETPGTGTVFGIWGARPDDVWAVGGVSGTGGGFAWRFRGDRWEEEPSLPTDLSQDSAIWKVNGRGADDAWLVGSNGVALYWNGTILSPRNTGVATSLFTVASDDDRFVAVGGLGSGIIVEFDGQNWTNKTPESAPMGLAGVVLGPNGTGYAVGHFGTVLERANDTWRPVDLGFYIERSLHAAWIDPDGGLWTVGGQVFSRPVTDGLLLHLGDDVNSTGL